LKPPELVIATTNQGKLREVRDILGNLRFKLSTLRDYPNLEPVAETGTTFAENAALKACDYARQTGLLTLADDSGLEVRALRGTPGIYSARYLGEATSYTERIQAILSALETHQDRAARFVCVIVIAAPDGTPLHTSTGICEGHIANSARGQGGFGYDPIFIPDGHDRTFAEIPSQFKNRISHRARALRSAREFLESLTRSSADD
jgi:XTP/dITP diphosphohydrolase